jgi:phosphoenolpyruvate carboxylase
MRRENPMANHEQLAGELKVLEELLKQTSTEHKRREIIERIDQIKAEQQEQGGGETKNSEQSQSEGVR